MFNSDFIGGFSKEPFHLTSVQAHIAEDTDEPINPCFHSLHTAYLTQSIPQPTHLNPEGGGTTCSSDTMETGGMPTCCRNTKHHNMKHSCSRLFTLPQKGLHFPRLMNSRPITVAARSKAWNVFARSNSGIVSSNPTQGMDVCLRLFCVCAALCR
jgi:hypothetical protein